MSRPALVVALVLLGLVAPSTAGALAPAAGRQAGRATQAAVQAQRPRTTGARATSACRSSAAR